MMMMGMMKMPPAPSSLSTLLTQIPKKPLCLSSPPLPFTFPALRFPFPFRSHNSSTPMSNSCSVTNGNPASSPDPVSGPWLSVPGLRLRDHRFTVPLDYSGPPDASAKISVFAREVVAVSSKPSGRGNSFEHASHKVKYMLAGKEEEQLPYLLYLQGGPGFESPRPTESSGWIHKACEEFRVILMDQRGTGLSTPLIPSSMSQFESAKALADYLTYFRGDSIVNDAEIIRMYLVPDAKPWTILGQSYGGFCAVSYLSFAPKGLKQVLLTGGIPPIGNECSADDVYRACFQKVISQNEKYYQRYPQDLDVVKDIVKYLEETEDGGVPLPSGGILTPRGLQALGLSGLGSSSGFERLHYMLEWVWDPILVPGAPKKISYFFLKAFEHWLSFDTNPLYALLHESIYCQGASAQWSAHRIRAENGEKFDAIKAVKENRPVYFTGEMVFPWMFDEIHALKPFKEAANILAEKDDWPPLYDKAALNSNEVPVAAAVYYDDMYVNFELSMETASQIAGIRLWITNEYMHSGLRDAGCQVLDHLLGMLNGKRPLF